MNLNIFTKDGITLTYPTRWDQNGRRTICKLSEEERDPPVAILERRIKGRRQYYGLLDLQAKPLNEFNTVTDALNWIVDTGLVK